MTPQLSKLVQSPGYRELQSGGVGCPVMGGQYSRGKKDEWGITEVANFDFRRMSSWSCAGVTVCSKNKPHGGFKNKMNLLKIWADKIPEEYDFEFDL